MLRITSPQIAASSRGKGRVRTNDEGVSAVLLFCVPSHGKKGEKEGRAEFGFGWLEMPLCVPFVSQRGQGREDIQPQQKPSAPSITPVQKFNPLMCRVLVKVSNSQKDQYPGSIANIQGLRLRTLKKKISDRIGHKIPYSPCKRRFVLAKKSHRSPQGLS